MITSVRGLTVSIGGRRLLDGVDLDLPPGTVTAVIGPNGAGKTTLLDALTGDVISTGDIVRPSDDRTARLLQGSPLPDTLTVGELLDIATSSGDDALVLADRFGLAAHLDKRISTLSTGMRRVLDLAVTTGDAHDLLLLDEPAAGLAQGELVHLAGLIRRQAEGSGTAVLLVEHNRELVDLVADRIVVLDGGRIVAHSDTGVVAAARSDSAVSHVAPSSGPPWPPSRPPGSRRLRRSVTSCPRGRSCGSGSGSSRLAWPAS